MLLINTTVLSLVIRVKHIKDIQMMSETYLINKFIKHSPCPSFP